MPLPYRLILCEEGTEKLLPMGPEIVPPFGEAKKGDEWPVWIDGKQVYCEVIKIGEPKWDYDEDGNDILCQDLRVKRP